MPAQLPSKSDRGSSLELSQGNPSNQNSKDDVTVVDFELLAPIPEERRVYMEWSKMSAWVPGTFIPKNRIIEGAKSVKRLFTIGENQEATGPPPKRQIVFDNSGFVRPGEVAAMMGPSGSGKTTMISILGGRAPKMMTVSGRSTFNGHEMSKPIRRSIGYVSQDDLLYESLTVYETLYYAALLRLPKFMTRSEKLERVEAVISALGLNKCRDTLIGGAFRRGVSGGERKRVSVGHELLINPSVLILDEPTSGLDSTTAMHLITTLRNLASGGRAILTTIHQPSSRLYNQLDTVMLLSEGRVLYYGTSQLTVEWFQKQGFPLPYGVNVAEYILDISNGDIEGQGMDGEESRQHLVKAMTDYLHGNPRGFIKSEEQELRRASEDLKDFVPFDVTNNNNSKTNLLEPKKKSDRWGATFLEQFFILTSRAIRNRRFKSMSTQSILQTIATSIVVILLWWQSGDGDSLLAAVDVSALIFFVLIYVNFSQLFKAIYTFPNVFNLMVKERTSGMYRLSAFYLSETFCDLPMDYSIPLIFVVSSYWGVHLRQDAGAFIGNVSVMLISGLCIQTIGLLLGATVRNPETAVSFATVLMIALMLTTGFWVRDIPSWLEWLKYVGPPYWAFRVLLQIEFGGKEYWDCGGLDEEQLPREECTEIEDLGDELNFGIDVNGEKWPGIVVLFGILIFLRIMTYYVLREKTKFSI